jgi:hypothetical protein
MGSNKKPRLDVADEENTPLGNLKLLLCSKPDSWTLLTYLKANDMMLDDNAHVRNVSCRAVLCRKLSTISRVMFCVVA